MDSITIRIWLGDKFAEVPAQRVGGRIPYPEILVRLPETAVIGKACPRDLRFWYDEDRNLHIDNNVKIKERKETEEGIIFVTEPFQPRPIPDLWGGFPW